MGDRQQRKTLVATPRLTQELHHSVNWCFVIMSFRCKKGWSPMLHHWQVLAQASRTTTTSGARAPRYVKFGKRSTLANPPEFPAF